MEANRRRVLVFPGGTEIGLEINRALRYCKEVQLFSAGEHGVSHAPYVFANHFSVSSVHSPTWIDALNDIILDNGIDYIFPAHDDVVLALARNAHRVAAKVVCSPLNTCEIARSKSKTYMHLQDVVSVPTLYECPEHVAEFPVFIKPDRGQGSQGASVAYNIDELKHYLSMREGLIICEYLPGEEYTIDCFSDRRSGLLFSSARQRIRTRNGISVATRAVRDPVFADMARAIASKLEFHGAWFFQVKRAADGVLKLLEVAPRIAGSMALHRVKGVNFPLLSILEQERVKLSICVNEIEVEMDRALTNRYRHTLFFETVYIDLDDTLLIGDKVNIPLIGFLYQCINNGKKIVLVTRHRGNLSQTLCRHRLENVFDDIIHLGPGQKKSSAISNDKNAIFIDDSYSERIDVSCVAEIPTFDTSMVEVLFDKRV